MDGSDDTGGSTIDCGRDFRRAAGQAGSSLTKLIVWIEEMNIELTPDLVRRIEGLEVIIGRFKKTSGNVLTGNYVPGHREVPT